MKKSPLEIDRIRKSVNAVAAVEAAIAEGYRPGMTEVNLMRVINHARVEQEGMGLGDDTVSLAHFSARRDRASIIDLMALEGVPITKDYAIQFETASVHIKDIFQTVVGSSRLAQWQTRSEKFTG